MNFKEILTNYGADVKDIEYRFMGNLALYGRCLKKLVEEPGFQKLKDCYEAKDVEGCFEASHSLKGVTANLSLTPLYNSICDIVELTRKGSLDFTLDCFEKERDKVFNIIKEL